MRKKKYNLRQIKLVDKKGRDLFSNLARSICYALWVLPIQTGSLILVFFCCFFLLFVFLLLFPTRVAVQELIEPSSGTFTSHGDCVCVLSWKRDECVSEIDRLLVFNGRNVGNALLLLAGRANQFIFGVELIRRPCCRKRRD